MRLALELKQGKKFNGRDLRMKKAVEPKRLEKKAMRRVQIGEEKAKAKEEREKIAKADDALLAGGRKFEDAYQSDDSHDEIMKRLAEENKK